MARSRHAAASVPHEQAGNCGPGDCVDAPWSRQASHQSPRQRAGMARAGSSGSSGKYGADLTTVQFAKLIVGLCTGTLIEWFDFTIYSQLSSLITKEFFPSGNPTADALSFWAVYAVGFISRPVGSILFGHIGDAHSRRAAMLASITCVSASTVLIGCLPTFRHAGYVAPALLALLRLLQGLAIGGEYGSAIVYLYEVAPVGRKGIIASLGELAVAPGIILGIITVQVVVYACTPAQLALWGWRVPFLLTAVFAPAALILRMHMPEPYEFLQSKQQHVLQRVASTAASHVARANSRQHTGSFCSGSAGALSQLSARLHSMTRVVDLVEQPNTESSSSAVAAAAAPAQAAVRHCSAGLHEPKLQVPLFSRRGSWDVVDAGDAGGALGKHASHELQGPPPVPEECKHEYMAEVQALQGSIKHHVPLLVLLRQHWRGVLLQFLFEANYGAAFYIFFSWVPTYLEKHTGLSMQMVLWAVLLGMVYYAAAVPLSGWASDKGVPRVWVCMAVALVLGGAGIPVLLALQTGSLAALWTLLPLMLGLCGVVGGQLPSIGPQIYPAAVRTSGFNLAHNLAMPLFGGLAPLVVSAMAISLQPATLAAGVLLLLYGVLTCCAGVGLVKVAPHVNVRGPPGTITESIMWPAPRAVC